MDEDEYDIPLRDQRFFGAGVKRKRIRFIPSAENGTRPQSLPLPASSSSSSAADKYLSIVLKKTKDVPATVPQTSDDLSTNTEPYNHKDDNDAHLVPNNSSPDPERAAGATCNLCRRPITPNDAAAAHESTIVHQICLTHSHPPSALDRSRLGLSVLQTQGWDPDRRLGLGAHGSEGILHPVRAKGNPDRAGLGVRRGDRKAEAVAKPVRLDAGRVRMMEKEAKKKAERLRDAFYRDEDVEKYLGVPGLSGEEGWDVGMVRNLKPGRRRRGLNAVT